MSSSSELSLSSKKIVGFSSSLETSSSSSSSSASSLGLSAARRRSAASARSSAADFDLALLYKLAIYKSDSLFAMRAPLLKPRVFFVKLLVCLGPCS